MTIAPATSKAAVNLGPFAPFAPTMNVVGFIECPLALARTALKAWRNEIAWRFEAAPTTSGPFSALRMFEPLTWPFDVEALLETTAGWTVYVNNSVRGTEPAPIRQLALQTRSRAVMIRLLPHTIVREGPKLAGCYGVTEFCVYAPELTEWVNTDRVVRVSNEGRWLFHAKGEPMPFEKVEQYAAKRNRDRLSPQDVLSYCAAIAIRPYDLGFYGDEGHILRFIGGPPRSRHASFAQARANLRLSP